jgi:hypothetical protein
VLIPYGVISSFYFCKTRLQNIPLNSGFLFHSAVLLNNGIWYLQNEEVETTLLSGKRANSEIDYYASWD